MSVYIKGMQMPKNCYECMFSDDMSISKGRPFWGCTVNGMELDEDDDGSDGRNPGCPMIEVPPHHGPLIDANGYVRVELMMRPGRKCAANLISAALIPAEEGE